MILITGANGFVGRSLVPYLSDAGISILALPRDSLNNFNFQRITNNLNGNSIYGIVHLAGKAHDLKNDISANEYYQVNTELTKKIYSDFVLSSARVFIFMSSVKACADKLQGVLTEETTPDPLTHYGKSKLLAEEFILTTSLPKGKRVYILRPCMIHGRNNKGNFNLLYKFAVRGFPWILGSFENQRSFCSIDNLNFIIEELINNEKIPSGVYNIADDDSLSTNELINLISESQNKNSHIWHLPKSLINTFAKIGDILKLPLNSERLVKLTESYIVSNNKIKNAINKPFPLSSREGLKKTLNSFKIDAQ
jgi:nucleoside-diphosphate-sugar epimerase